MPFTKDGETKIFITKNGDAVKKASKEEAIRYGIDDLVKDSMEKEDSSEKSEEEENVSR